MLFFCFVFLNPMHALEFNLKRYDRKTQEQGMQKSFFLKNREGRGAQERRTRRNAYRKERKTDVFSSFLALVLSDMLRILGVEGRDGLNVCVCVWGRGNFTQLLNQNPRHMKTLIYESLSLSISFSFSLLSLLLSSLSLCLFSFSLNPKVILNTMKSRLRMNPNYCFNRTA